MMMMMMMIMEGNRSCCDIVREIMIPTKQEPKKLVEIVWTIIMNVRRRRNIYIYIYILVMEKARRVFYISFP